MRILFIGDIVGAPGRRAMKEVLPRLKSKFNPDFIIANGENSAAGRGITHKIVRELFELGVHGITMGNHTWGNKDIFEFIDDEPRLIRPLNYSPGMPGRGYTVVHNGKKELGLINAIGRTYMQPMDDPFRSVDAILDEWNGEVKCILVDFHAEATSEKISMGWHLDGRVSAVVGTHTHVQTHDERILPQGTAYVSDVGMVGPRDGVLGMEREAVLLKFRTELPSRFIVDEGKWQFHAVIIEVDDTTGLSTNIQLIRQFEDEWILE
ncbi:MAG: TIGR00282 family metallophosphoesterase [Paenibacillaceae bacterium]